MRKHLGERLARLAVGREQADLDSGMTRQQAHEFRARVAAGAENADPKSVRALAHRSLQQRKGGCDRRNLPGHKTDCSRCLALRELEAASRLALAVLLALNDAAVARQETALLEDRAQCRLEMRQRTADAVADGARLAG